MGTTSKQVGAAAASVLASTQVTCLLPVKDMARARRFYEEALGLVPLDAKPDGKFVYHCGGTELALFPKPEGTKAEHTAISFKEVADIATAIASDVQENCSIEPPLSDCPIASIGHRHRGAGRSTGSLSALWTPSLSKGIDR
jgi:hypothetical protein